MINLFNSRLRIGLAIFFAAFTAIVLPILILNSESSTQTPADGSVELRHSSGTVKNGDTLTTIFSRHRASSNSADRLQLSFSKSFDARRLKPGHSYEISLLPNGTVTRFIYNDDITHAITVERTPQGTYSASAHRKQTRWMERTIQGQISENLYRDLLKQGLEEALVADVVANLSDNIFGWRIDFFTEQRPGDTFSLVLSEEIIDDSDAAIKTGDAHILAVSYRGRATRQKENYAFRYTAPAGGRTDYYDAAGQAIRRAFLRAPFTQGAFRVSSNFNPKRFHPILRVYRPHHGTDYAANRGTPVAAIGNGTVIFAGRKSGYGRCLEIRHSSTHVSRYGHLSKMAVKRGKRILQGQYIGNVGSSGLSTGPHLHFEMLVDGKQRNFLTMNFPAASSVSKRNMSDFKRICQVRVAQLKDTTPILSAKKKSTPDLN